MSRKRCRPVCVQCQKTAAKYPENWKEIGLDGPVLCNSYCVMDFFTPFLKKDMFTLCEKHCHYYDPKIEDCCVKCLYEKSLENAVEVKNV
jgi:hypothetical protein